MQEWREEAQAMLARAPGIYGVYAATQAATVFEYQASHVFPSASTIKVLVMAELLRQVDQREHMLTEQPPLPATPVGGCGILDFLSPAYHPDITELLHFMICCSDNRAANALIEFTGMEAINRLAAEIGMPDTRLRRVMMDVEAARQGRENTTSPADMGHLFNLLSRNELVSATASATMKTVLGRQQFSDVMMLLMPDSVHAEHKTGSLPGSVLDVGIVYGGQSPLILCLMATQLPSNGDGAVLLGKIASMIYKAHREAC